MQGALAQMPKNADKDFEYSGEATVRKAGSGDLLKRFEHWAKDYFSDATSVDVAVDDSTERYVEVKVVESLVESHFGVNYTHKDRSLTYLMQFDADRKNYKYKINGFYYKAIEIDRKGRETPIDSKLSEVKGASTKSLDEELHERMQGVIASFTEAAEKELE